MQPTIEAHGVDSVMAIKYRRAFDSGERAKHRGFERISPFAGKDHWIDWWFFAGFDGLTIDQAWEEFRKENLNG